MAQLLDRFGQPMPRVSPFREAGVSGTAVFGGYVVSKERSSALTGTQKYVTASNLLTNVSIVAAGVRYFLNLLAKPRWSLEARGVRDDRELPEEVNEFVHSTMEEMNTNWARFVRRCGLYRFHGFGIQEWTAKKREDGKIVYKDIESRPQHTIERWKVDEQGAVLGVFQRSPQTGRSLGIPREKFIYLVDDTLTDSPEGMGWFRHLVDPAERLKTYLQLEGYGFQRDLSGTPIGRAPLTLINDLVKQRKLTDIQADEMLNGMREFVRLQAKKPETGILLDSATYEGQTADGISVSSVAQWGMELLTGETTSLDKVDRAIVRLVYDMARIIGVESLLVGSDSTGAGSHALSKDKSNNLYLQVQSTLVDMAATFSRDYVDPLWMLNGMPDESKPKMKTEDVAFKDIEQIAGMLRDIATAGGVLQPDDPAINDLRDLAGISHAPELDEETLGMMRNQQMGLLPDGTHPLERELDASLEEAKLNGSKKPKPKNGAAT